MRYERRKHRKMLKSVMPYGMKIVSTRGRFHVRLHVAKLGEKKGAFYIWLPMDYQYALKFIGRGWE